MPTLNSAWVWLDLSPTIAVANPNQLIAQAVPVAGKIKSVIVGINTVLTTGGGTLPVAKGSASIISSATYNLGAGDTPDLVAATPEVATLTTTTGTLKVAALDLIKATWVLTTAAVTNAAICLVGIEPDYRMRLFSLDRWNLWRRLTLYRNWRGRDGQRMDGTNNATERAIGWRVKERYRTMRGYKRQASVLNVSRLIAWAGNLLDAGGADLAALVA